ncbi:endothelial lipase isoform X2 [Protopterus annectens]|uniref:endothelial lipase isoform X2 n=1 Tax=Protopterus annectens TaxID=7888 RepID=UPI001CFB3832|nr:endothelial lipase isoform X2 [Protopterus annectens]
MSNDNTIAELLNEELETETAAPSQSHIKYILHTMDQAGEGCNIIIGEEACLEKCVINATEKIFLVIHGWTMSGMVETWLNDLVRAIQEREKYANVIVVDWIPLAHTLYTEAVNNTKSVGKDIAKLLHWLQEVMHIPLQNVHMIGYSLGAHVAGYAGNYVNGTIGRITGLDPAGPMFEGVEHHKRLSPDDADFVDVLHTYTREALGISIGIQMPVGHIDLYPNGGDFQPGCGLSDVLGTIASGGITEAIKCEHERSVQLFVDSLLNQEQQSLAYRCTDPSRFKKGVCLSCRKARCNKVGYNINVKRMKRNSKMYLKTRADMPFKVYHYQIKMHIFSFDDVAVTEPVFSVTLYGTMNDLERFPLELSPYMGFNSTHTFLVYTEADIGDIKTIKLSWEETSSSWSSFLASYWNYWSSGTSKSAEKKDVMIRRIRVKSGETQKKFAFCAEKDSQIISPGTEVSYVKCGDGWDVRHQKRIPS